MTSGGLPGLVFGKLLVLTIVSSVTARGGACASLCIGEHECLGLHAAFNPSRLAASGKPASISLKLRMPNVHILCQCADKEAAAVFQTAFGIRARCVNTVARVAELIEESLPSLLFVTPWDSEGARLAPVVAQLRPRLAGTLVVAYVGRDARSLHELVHLVAAGATQVILRGVEDSPKQLRALFEDPLAVAIHEAHYIARMTVNSRAYSFLDYCFHKVIAPSDAQSMAAELGVSRRTLSKMGRRIGARGARGTMTKCRLLVCAALIKSGVSVERSALILGLASGSQLSAMLQRHAGTRASCIKGDSDLMMVGERLFPRRDAKSLR